MAIKLLEFLPSGGSAGNKIVNFADAPAGISYNEDHLNPVHARRTQDGTLITQQVRYNKKNFSITLGLHSKALKTYFQLLYEESVNTVLKIWSENETTYAEEAEFNKTVRIVDLKETHDQASNIRTLTLTIMEV